MGVFQKIYEKNIVSGNGDNDENSETEFIEVFDGYRWVKKPKEKINKAFDIMKPGKTMIITNVPLHMNILPIDFKNYLKNIMYKHGAISTEEKELDFIKHLELDQDKNMAYITFHTEEFAKRLILIDGESLLGFTIRVSPYIESKYEENASKGVIALSENADFSAKSAAIAYATLQCFVSNQDVSTLKHNDKQNNIENNKINNENNISNTEIMISDKEKTNNSNSIALFGKYKNINLNFSNKVQISPEIVIKISGIMNESVLTIPSKEYKSIKEDVKSTFGRYGNIVNFFVVSRKSYSKIGAELGSIFIEFEDVKYSEIAYHAMKDKKFDNKSIKLSFIPKEVFYSEIFPSDKKNEINESKINESISNLNEKKMTKEDLENKIKNIQDNLNVSNFNSINNGKTSEAVEMMKETKTDDVIIIEEMQKSNYNKKVYEELD